MAKGLWICPICLNVLSTKRNHCPDCKNKATDSIGIFSNFSEAQKEKERIEGNRSGNVAVSIASQ